MKKWKSLIITLGIAFAIGFPVASPVLDNVAVVEAATIKISKTKVTLEIGETKTLRILGNTKKVTWKSSKKSVATITSKGKVSAKAAGTAKITALVGNKKYTCVVTVKKSKSAAVDTKDGLTATPTLIPTPASDEASSNSMEYATGAYLNGIVKLSPPPQDLKAPTDAVTGLSQLKERIIYINNNCASGEHTIKLSGFTLSDANDIYNVVYENGTMLGSVENYLQYYRNDTVLSIVISEKKTLQYELARAFADDSYLEVSSTDINAVAKEIFPTVKEILLSNIEPDMTDYEKEKAIHDYMVNQYAYDIDLEIFSVKGILLNKEGVCQAYADTFQLLMNLMGIQCITQTGNAGGGDHAWNIIMLDGEWYNVDVTWDDPISDRDILRYDYFNVTDEQLSKDHLWLPEEGISATATKYAYSENEN